MPCRSRVTGRYLPATRILVDRLAKVDLGVERGFDALRPLETIVKRAAAGPLGPEDVAALETLHGALWAALERIGDDVEGVRELVGAADA